eukprot:gene7977-9813_t
MNKEIKIILVLSCLLFITFNGGFVNAQQDDLSYSSEEEITNNNLSCYSKTFAGCMTSGACCVWCSNSSSIFNTTTNQIEDTTGVCKWIDSIVNCPTNSKDALTICQTNGLNYKTSACTCNKRATSTNDANRIFTSTTTYLTLSFALIH